MLKNQWPKPILGFCAYSGTGKTTLLSQLIPILRNRGIQVGVIKHAHHNFEMDREGKDSFRFRQAGATEVMLASSRRWVLLHENSEKARKAIKVEINPSIIYVIENIEPFKKYIKKIRALQLRTNEEVSVRGRLAYKWICFGESSTPSPIKKSEVRPIFAKLVRELRSLKEIIPTLLERDIGIRAIWSSYDMLYDLKTEKEKVSPDWMKFSKWYVTQANKVINDGWFVS